MKKLVSVLIAAAMIAVMTVCVTAAFKASFSLTGPASARAGNSIAVSFKADGSGICGILADITYDTSKLTYTSSSGALKNWRVEVNGGDGKLQIWAEENNSFKSPINSQSTVITLNFKVNNNASTGDKITVKANVTQVSDGNDELNGLTASYSLTVSRPLSTDSSLKSLSVEGYTLKPEFSPKTTEYEIDGEVEYTLAALGVKATANDSEASVETSGARLSVGDNMIRVKVKAEDGEHSTTYTIRAKMKQDPDYVASSDTGLSGLRCSEGTLTPPLSDGVFDYAVYVPYEVTNADFTVSVKDGKAHAQVQGGEEFSVGDNAVTVIVTAEDGTTAEYRITVVRMPEYYVTEETETETETEAPPDTDPDTVTETDTEPDVQTDPLPDTGTEPETTEEIPDTTAADKDVTETEAETTGEGIVAVLTRNVPMWAVIAAAVGGIVVGLIGCMLVLSSLKERK